MPAREGVGSKDGWLSLLIQLMLAQGDGGMDALATADVFLFEGCRLDRRGLSRRDQSGAFVPVPIGSGAFEILGVLVERAGESALMSLMSHLLHSLSDTSARISTSQLG